MAGSQTQLERFEIVVHLDLDLAVFVGVEDRCWCPISL
jgi:hypothetical protein